MYHIFFKKTYVYMYIILVYVYVYESFFNIEMQITWSPV